METGDVTVPTFDKASLFKYDDGRLNILIVLN